MKETAQILNRLERIEKLIKNGKEVTPRLTRNEAKKFLAIGEVKFRTLKRLGMIKERVDLFGQKYYLKDELINLMKEGMTAPVVKNYLRKAS